MKIIVAPICSYCGKFSALVNGTAIYPHRPDLAALPFYQCAPCSAYVGCHPGTTQPLGRLANAALRRAKSAAHRAFDPLWQSGDLSRKAAYSRLATNLGIDAAACHIGMFDKSQCAATVDFGESYSASKDET